MEKGASKKLILVAVAVLLTSLGGQTYAMTSPVILSLGGLAFTSAFAFAQVELRAKEPILPMNLFKYNTFRVMSSVGFVIGIALFGTMFSTSLTASLSKPHSRARTSIHRAPK